MTESSVYWILKLDAIISFLGGVTFFSVVMAFVFVFIAGFCVVFANDSSIKEEEQKLIKKGMRIFIPLAIAMPFFIMGLSLTRHMLPTTKQYLIIKGVSYATNNERIVTTADKIFDGVEEYIDKKLNEGEIDKLINDRLDEEATK